LSASTLDGSFLSSAQELSALSAETPQSVQALIPASGSHSPKGDIHTVDGAVRFALQNALEKQSSERTHKRERERCCTSSADGCCLRVRTGYHICRDPGQDIEGNGDRGGQQPAEPFRIAGNFYYIGAKDGTSFLITGPEGHVVLDEPIPHRTDDDGEHCEARL
jgi:hypothetical protein